MQYTTFKSSLVFDADLRSWLTCPRALKSKLHSL